MGFIQLVIDVDSKSADRLSDIFMELDALSATVTDQHEGTSLEQPLFNEPGYEVQGLWDNSHLVVLFNSDADIEQIVVKATEFFETSFSYVIEYIDDQDWVRLTQSQFEPIKINDKLYIIPSWHDCPNQEAVTITLDPGLAFGTGSHPTTFMCLDWISCNVNSVTKNVLDYGCGSGILAIAAKKFGANEVYGIDIDEQALEASKSNAAINNVDIKFGTTDYVNNKKFEFVVANILSNPLRILAPALAKLTGKKLILSGILDIQSEELTGIYKQWFNKVIVINSIDGWVLLECSF
ncbi:MAG: ribosomal protein methyltransferase [Burkholderiales bacterium]|jgi:ribosomal protein L11 methyltransferase|nr:ribosomal protein methyltransferase [Burkholderiales bacterium]